MELTKEEKSLCRLGLKRVRKEAYESLIALSKQGFELKDQEAAIAKVDELIEKLTDPEPVKQNISDLIGQGGRING